MRQLVIAAVAAAALLCAAGTARADEDTHTYADGEPVIVYANKIGPFNNPLETYAFFEMPGCPPASRDSKFPSLGQALAGDELYPMNIPAKFKQSIERAAICTVPYKEEDHKKWRAMVAEQYWYQLVADDLPMWATLGKAGEVGAAEGDTINTHQNFSFGYNGDRIVSVNLTADTPVALSSKEPITFTYSVSFVERPEVSFERRFDRYLDDTFFEHQTHWFSIFNSFMLVFFLVGVVLVILNRTLKADYARFDEYRAAKEMGKEDWIEDRGWKQLQHDVFRVPPRPVLLCALVGTGCQIGILVLVVSLISIVAVVYTHQGSFATYSLLAFAGTSYAAGFFSAAQFSQYALVGPTISSQWIKCMLTTALLYPGTILGMGFLLNFVAIGYDSAQIVHAGSMVVLLFLWLCVSLPLVVVGTVVGRHSRLGSNSAGGARLDVPRVNQIPRMIPARRWYASRRLIVLACGVLPFISIFIELYFVFTSFWNYKVYYVYGFMLLVLLIFVIVTACVSVAATYGLLSTEDHRWPWTSFAGGASTALYVFAYATYYYIYKTRMTGFFMLSFYFTYTTMLCVTISVLSGTVAFLAASKFVNVIYRDIKGD